MDSIRIENGRLVLAKEVSTLNDEKEIDIDNVKLDLRIELSTIIRQVKSLKARAMEIQNILEHLDNN